MGKNKRIVSKVADIYDWLDSLLRNNNADRPCEKCGECCDFEAYDHRLFVTTPEIFYLTEHLGKENIKPMPTGRCPYNIENKCTIHKLRFAGCRIFNCKAENDFQSSLSEAAIKKFKIICENMSLPYQYTDLPTALKISQIN